MLVFRGVFFVTLSPGYEKNNEHLRENVFNHLSPSQYEPGSKLLVLGMVIQPLIGNPYNDL